jgi:hypothetical protein
MFAYASEEAGKPARADFDHLTFPQAVQEERSNCPTAFLDRVVPAILATTT